MKPTLSIIVPAYNEELNVSNAISSLIKEIKNSVSKYQIIIVNDGSTDGTLVAAHLISKRYKNIEIIDHKENKGFGKTILTGIKAAKLNYVVGFPGDNDTSAVSLREMIDKIGRADLIISYTKNTHSRSLIRRFFSQGFIILMNILLRMNLRYYNGSFVCKTADLKKIRLISKGFTIYAEAKVRLIKKGYTYIEVPFEHIGRKYGKSKATNVKSVIETLQVIFTLVKDYHFK